MGRGGAVPVRRALSIAIAGASSTSRRPGARSDSHDGRPMNQVGRNAPCPCGSGRKFKQCCGRAGGGSGSPRNGGEACTHTGVPPELIAGHDWEADIFPLPITFEDDARARPTALVVTANELVLASETPTTPLGEYDQIAGKLARAIEKARRATGVTPPRVVVRWEEIARELRTRLPDGVAVAVAPSLDGVVAAGRALLMNVADFPHWPAVSNPDSWLAWGLPRPMIVELFDAAADFHRSRPWRLLSDIPPLIVKLPGERTWTVAIMGSGGEEFGLTMYAEPDDYLRTIDAEDAEKIPGLLAGRTLALGFSKRGELPRRIQREVASSGWRVAATDAYPILLPMNTPAGGISRADAGDLIAVLRAVPAFVTEHAHRFDDERVPARAFTIHEPTGVAMLFDATIPWIVKDDAFGDVARAPGDPSGGERQDDGLIVPHAAFRLDPDNVREAAEWIVRRFEERRRRGRGRLRREPTGRDRIERGLPPKGTPEAVPAVLRDAIARIAEYAERDQVADGVVAGGAMHLLREYARLNPDEISRVLKPETWAAGALHAAFVLASTVERSASQLADAFGVSSSAVNVRSRRLREAVAWPAARAPRGASRPLSLWPEAEEDPASASGGASAAASGGAEHGSADETSS